MHISSIPNLRRRQNKHKHSSQKQILHKVVRCGQHLIVENQMYDIPRVIIKEQQDPKEKNEILFIAPKVLLF
jgi:hypothetical protein